MLSSRNVEETVFFYDVSNLNLARRQNLSALLGSLISSSVLSDNICFEDNAMH